MIMLGRLGEEFVRVYILCSLRILKFFIRKKTKGEKKTTINKIKNSNEKMLKLIITIATHKNVELSFFMFHTGQYPRATKAPSRPAGTHAALGAAHDPGDAQGLTPGPGYIAETVFRDLPSHLSPQGSSSTQGLLLS